MSEINPPLVLEGGSHDSDLLRQMWGDTYTAGVVAADHLEVTEQDTPALGVKVAAGRAFVAGDEASTQGVYYVRNSDAHDVALATADATNDRIDLIGAQVKDSFYSGGDDEWELVAVTGTPAADPDPPAAPDNFLVLAEVTVPADAGGNPAITDSDIEDQRVRARSGGVAPGGVLGYATVTQDQAAISSEVDLTGLSATVDVPANRVIRVTGIVEWASAGGTSIANLIIKEDSTQLARAQTHVNADAAHIAQSFVILEPSAGSHTYKLAAAQESGAGTLRTEQSSDRPSFILVEDLGPA